jgi:CheY-like chemotaxis protein
VGLHNGTVRAASAGPGLGSEFTVTLPLGEAAAGQGPGVGSPARAGSLRVLIVEDNHDAAESLKLLLELRGHQVRVVHDGAAGVATARQMRPDVVLCDIGLPGDLDGYGVARTLRAESWRSALVAVSGYGQEEDKRKAREAGFDRHLTKPVDSQTLMQVLDALVPR